MVELIELYLNRNLRNKRRDTGENPWWHDRKPNLVEILLLALPLALESRNLPPNTYSRAFRERFAESCGQLGFGTPKEQGHIGKYARTVAGLVLENQIRQRKNELRPA